MRRLVLVGAGHAHLIVLEGLARAPIDADVHVVNLGDAPLYSGMVPGYWAGHYRREELTVDLPALCAAAHATLHVSGASALDADNQFVTLGDGTRLDYALAALDIGSQSRGDDAADVRRYAVLLKPMTQASTPELSRAADGVVVVGGGAAGLELALCLRARTGAATRLVSDAERVPAGASPRLAKAARAVLEEKGVELVRDRVTAIEEHRISLESGRELPRGLVVWATGPRAHAWLRASGAAVDAEGYVLVDDTLRSTSHASLFGAGDCVSFASGQPVKKAGVYSVREGPILLRNLRAALEGKPLQPYAAQPGFLSLLDVGDGTALGAWKGFVVRGRWVRRLKARIDRAFMARFPRADSSGSELSSAVVRHP
jgi:NADH dehydrogenase FAD-containing subunit